MILLHDITFSVFAILLFVYLQRSRKVAKLRRDLQMLRIHIKELSEKHRNDLTSHRAIHASQLENLRKEYEEKYGALIERIDKLVNTPTPVAAPVVMPTAPIRPVSEVAVLNDVGQTVVIDPADPSTWPAPQLSERNGKSWQR